MWQTWLEHSKPVVPVLVIEQLEDAVPLAEALVAGGIKLLEVTLRTDVALRAIQQISQQVEGAIVGAGTVTTAEGLQQAGDAGAQFAISPGLTPELAQAAKTWNDRFLPGVSTASEVMTAADHGFLKQKLFPAEAIGGQSLLKAFNGPFKHIRFCPTGGVSEQNYRSYLAMSNVFAVAGSWFVSTELIQAKDWGAITDIASQLPQSKEQ